MDINNKIENLIKSITHCPIDNDVECNSVHACHSIVNHQYGKENNPKKLFQLPEPWNGHIDKAEILFVGSNPSYNPDEEGYPKLSENLSSAQLKDFFETRFDEIEFNPRGYWTAINKWTGLILKLPTQAQKNLLKDHACLTELVHCKSTGSDGVTSKCCNNCSPWLEQIFVIFKENPNGQYIVFVGNTACSWYDRNCDKKGYLFEGKTIIKMPHPTPSYGQRPSEELCDEMIRMQIEENAKYGKVHLHCIKQIADNILAEKQIKH